MIGVARPENAQATSGGNKRGWTARVGPEPAPRGGSPDCPRCRLHARAFGWQRNGLDPFFCASGVEVVEPRRRSRVDVDAPREGLASVAEHVGDCGDVVAAVEQLGGQRMPQDVWGHPGDTC